MFSNRNNQHCSQRGASLYFAFLVMTLLLGIALGISALLLDQVKSIRGLGFSAFALEAADAGIEKIFYDDKKGVDVIAECPSQGSPPPSCMSTLSNGASYVAQVSPPGADCPAATYCAKSVGTFQNSVRALRILR